MTLKTNQLKLKLLFLIVLSFAAALLFTWFYIPWYQTALVERTQTLLQVSAGVYKLHKRASSPIPLHPQFGLPCVLYFLYHDCKNTSTHKHILTRTSANLQQEETAGQGKQLGTALSAGINSAHTLVNFPQIPINNNLNLIMIINIRTEPASVANFWSCGWMVWCARV